MKALSVRQPWAWLIVHGYKDVENRTWAPPPHLIGQRFYIHAPKTFDESGYAWVRRHCPDVPLPTKETFQRGGIIGSVVLTQCVNRWPSRWFAGPIGFVVTEPLPSAFRECPGHLGFFKA